MRSLLKYLVPETYTGSFDSNKGKISLERLVYLILLTNVIYCFVVIDDFNNKENNVIIDYLTIW